MKRALIALMGPALGVTACSAEPESQPPDTPEAPQTPRVADKMENVTRLVDRFSADACLEANPVATMRRTGPAGKTVLRAYAAPIACADEISAALETRGFSETAPGIFAYSSAGETNERVSIERAEDGSGAGIEWEVEGQ